MMALIYPIRSNLQPGHTVDRRPTAKVADETAAPVTTEQARPATDFLDPNGAGLRPSTPPGPQAPDPACEQPAPGATAAPATATSAAQNPSAATAAEGAL